MVLALAVVMTASTGPVPLRADDGDGAERPSMEPLSRELPRLYSRRSATQWWSKRGRANGFSRQFPEEYRSISGDGNNLGHPAWGAAQIPFVRSIPAAYHDGYLEPNGEERPSARLLSELLCAQSGSIPNEQRATDFIWQWGQFLDHDLDETPTALPTESFPIEVPAGDPWFDPAGTGSQVIDLSRSAHVSDVHGVRHQVNAITAFIDASNVYGSDGERALALRTLDGSGRLKTTDSPHGPLLPYNEAGFPNAGGDGANLFLAGDVRANEQVGLTAMHTLFVREHNYWADLIRRGDSRLDGDEIYQMARVIVGAEMQAITYREFLPVLLGSRAIPRYRGYREQVNPGISNLFATAAYRFGHSMLSGELQRLERGGRSSADSPLPLAQAFFNPAEIERGGIDRLLRGLASQTAQRVDNRVVDGVRNFLFGPPGAGGFDLASLNIQRGRDHGLPDYATVRAAFGLSPIGSFSDLRTVEPGMASQFELAYGSVDEIDAWTGLLCEAHVDDALVGETLRAVLVDQFTRLRDGDRFWYQHHLHPNLQRLVEKQTLAVIIRRHTGIGSELQDDVFRMKPERRPADRGPKFTGLGRSLSASMFAATIRAVNSRGFASVTARR